MNSKALHTLEYDKIIATLTDLASTTWAKETCRSLLPATSLAEIQKSQQETSDALSRILRHGSLSFGGVSDIRSSLMRLEVGSTLGIGELLSLSYLLNIASRAKAYERNFQNDSDSETVDTSVKTVPTDSLTEYFVNIEPLTPLAQEISRCILSEEEIADDASSNLRHIRRSIQQTNNKVHEQLGSVMNSVSSILQDNLVTMRNGRYCLPVKQEHRSSLPGMVHDQSSTGSTLFIEPMAVVKLNNELRELAIQEQQEIEKILADLSNLAAEHIEAIRSDYIQLTLLDFIFAKGKLARDMKATKPLFNEDGYINIKKGRHPLIPASKVVPIDIHMGRDYTLLIVTGPNTGGKTVSLKTVGLFTLMGQAGLHIPAFDDSELSVFEDVFADIGDEQSIEQSLSTFSSHMTNTVSILNEATSHSLALFDELGAGTDPIEGAALAMSILSDLKARGTITMATTHYSELKMFALTTDGVENACCEFDVESLRPTYHLLIGIPGKSNAFAISGKLGLPGNIITDAKARIDSESLQFEDVVSNLEATRKALADEKEIARIAREDAEKLRERLRDKNDRIDKAKEKILNRANEEAREILQSAKDYADESIRKYNRWVKDGGAGKEMEATRSELRDRLSERSEKLTIKPSKKPAKTHSKKDFRIGDTVFVSSMNLNGTVCSLPNDKGELTVQMGILSSKVNIRELQIVDVPKETQKTTQNTGSGKIKLSKSMTIHPDINLIGKTTDEAIALLDKYLDDAYLSHLPQVTVIHGRGTGALRKAVHNHLKKASYVKSYRLGEFGEGGQGVTIVEFK